MELWFHTVTTDLYTERSVFRQQSFIYVKSPAWTIFKEVSSTSRYCIFVYRDGSAKRNDLTYVLFVFARGMQKADIVDCDLYSFTRQMKIDHATNITSEITEYAYRLFKENYNWSKTIRSIGIRGADLVTDKYWEQIDLFDDISRREKMMKADAAVDDIRRRFGYYSVQRGLMYMDSHLSRINAKEDHTVHPHGYFG